MVGFFRLFHISFDGFSFLIQFKTYFRGVEVDGSVFKADIPHDSSEFIQFQDIFHRLPLFRFNNFLYFLVGKPAVGTNDCFSEPLTQHLCFVVYFKNGRESQLIFIRAQGANTVREFFGQHGNHAVHEIDGGCSFVRFGIQYRVGFHVIRHIGNVHTHFPQAIAKTLQGDGIIKIFGIRRVNGDGPHFPVIFPVGNLLFRNLHVDFFGFLFYIFRKSEWKIKIGKDRFHLHIVVAGFSQHFCYFTKRVVRMLGPIGNFHQYFFAVSGFFYLTFRNKNIVGHGLAVGHHKTKIFAQFENTDVVYLLPLQNFHNLAFGFVFFSFWEEKHFYMIAVQRMMHVVGGNKNIFAPFIGKDISFPRFFQFYGSGDVFLFVSQRFQFVCMQNKFSFLHFPQDSLLH